MVDEEGAAEGRWPSQRSLALRIARTTTRILPDGEGVALRFINHQTDESSTLRLEDIGRVLNSIPARGGTYIGRKLRERILQPMVYEPLTKGTLKRPLLVSILTDGAPSKKDEELVNVIVQCGNTLEDYRRPRDGMLPVSLNCVVLVVFGLLSMFCRCQVLDWPNWVIGRSQGFFEQTRKRTQTKPGAC